MTKSLEKLKQHPYSLYFSLYVLAALVVMLIPFVTMVVLNNLTFRLQSQRGVYAQSLTCTISTTEVQAGGTFHLTVFAFTSGDSYEVNLVDGFGVSKVLLGVLTTQSQSFTIPQSTQPGVYAVMLGSVGVNCGVLNVTAPSTQIMPTSCTISPNNIVSPGSFYLTANDFPSGSGATYPVKMVTGLGTNPISLGNLTNPTQAFNIPNTNPGLYYVLITTNPGTDLRCNPELIVTAPVSCLPATQSSYKNNAVNFSAAGGNGTYSWSAPGGLPSSGTGSSFITAYSTLGTKTVTVTSGGNSATCTISVISRPAPTVCDADVDKNGVVNSADLGLVAANFGKKGTLAGPYDVDKNGVVNSADLGIVSKFSGQKCI